MFHFNVIIIISACLIFACAKEEQQINTDYDPIISKGISCEDWAEFRINDFLLSNNIWGKGTTTNYEQCIYYEQSNSKTEFGWNWDWPGNGSVRAYPEIIFGLKPWSSNSTSALLPAQINSNEISLQHSISASAIGQWNLAYDIWLTNTMTPAPANVTHEIMIWMHKTDSISPAGTIRGTIIINEDYFDLWVNENHGDGWTYIAFVSNSSRLNKTLNLNDFIYYLIDNSYITSDLYISGIEFGTEIFEGKGNIKVSSYIVELQ